MSCKTADHGTTSVEETVLVCERLHQDIHIGKRTIRLRNNRLIRPKAIYEGEANLDYPALAQR